MWNTLKQNYVVILVADQDALNGQKFYRSFCPTVKKTDESRKYEGRAFFSPESKQISHHIVFVCSKSKQFLFEF